MLLLPREYERQKHTHAMHQGILLEEKVKLNIISPSERSTYHGSGTVVKYTQVCALKKVKKNHILQESPKLSLTISTDIVFHNGVYFCQLVNTRKMPKSCCVVGKTLKF